MDENASVLEVAEHLFAFLHREVGWLIVQPSVQQIVDTHVDEETTGVVTGLWNWAASAVGP